MSNVDGKAERRIRTQDNNFDSLRILAAVVVMLSHSVPLSYGDNAREIFWQASHGRTTGGLLAVVVFFVMSGYLISASFQRSTSVLRFAVARLLRLAPALAVAVLLLAVVVGPLVSDLSTPAYFHDRGVYVFIARNMAFLHTETLPSVFQSNPFSGAIDGSLWTLRHEVECYLLTAGLGLIGWLKPVRISLLYAALAIASLQWPGSERVMLIGAFLGGVAIQLWKPSLSGRIASACLLGWAATIAAGWAPFGSVVFGPYVVLFMALSPAIRLPRLGARGDLSYGTYVYAFPVQQLVAVSLGGAITWYWDFALALPVVLTLAYLSWRFVEAPSLAFKERLRPAARPMLAT